MPSSSLAASLTLLFAELTGGAKKNSGYMLNGGDIGLLRSLDRLSARRASMAVAGGGSIAAHVDHLRYGIALMNRWQDGEADPWASADWAASWRTPTVTTAEWKALRADLRKETARWLKALQKPRASSGAALSGLIASIAHLAYHLGAIRQIDRSLRGPKAS